MYPHSEQQQRKKMFFYEEMVKNTAVETVGRVYFIKVF
jgi:hypothetical protein